MSYLRDILPNVMSTLARQNMQATYRDDPVRWAEDVLGIQLWSAQKAMLYSIRDNHNTAVAAAHGVGKTFTAAVAVCWWIDTHPWNSLETFVATTAPSKDQVDLIWSGVRSLVEISRQRFAEGLIDHALPGYITGDNKWKLENGDMLGQGRKPPDNKSDVAFQGRHADYLLAIGDEAVGLSEGFLTALGSIATAETNRVLILANPTNPGSAMAKYWPKKDGTGGNPHWKRLHISAYHSPMITQEEGFDTSKVKGLTGQGYIDRRLEEWGKDDPRFIARVLGEWAWDQGNSLFTDEILATAVRTVVVPDPEEPMIQFGLDVARMGGDASVVYEARVGDVWETDPETDKKTVNTGRRGLFVRFVKEWRKAPVTSNDPENPGTAQRVDALARSYGALAVNVDASGIGGGVIDALMDIDKNYEVYEVYGQSTADVDRRQYINLRAEQFGELKRRMMAGEIDISPKDEDLIEELRGIQYEWVPNGAMKIESKVDMKKRGVKSPDRADAMWYACLDIDGASGPKAGDMLLADPEDFVEDGGFFYGREGGIGSVGW